MRGLIRADWLRFRKRRSVQVVMVAIPLLAAFFFLTSYRSAVSSVPPFDPQAYRQELIKEGAVQGGTQQEIDQQLDEIVESQRQSYAQMQEQQDLFVGRFAFPQSVITVLGSGSFVFFALILLTAITIGDEFSSGTIRTALLASSDRRRLLLVRLAMLIGIGAALFAILAVLGVLLAAVLTATGATFKAPPPVDSGALAVVLVGDVLVTAVVICFAALGTLVVRSGSLTLVVVLAYVAIESAVLAVLSRFPAFQPAGQFQQLGQSQDVAPTIQPAGALEWALNLLPVHGVVTFFTSATRAAGGMPDYVGEEVTRDLGAAWLPLAALAVWGLVFAALAFRRFSRMDIVE